LLKIPIIKITQLKHLKN